jgi:hypothetical protein
MNDLICSDLCELCVSVVKKIFRDHEFHHA